MPEYKGDVVLLMCATVPSRVEIQAKNGLGGAVIVRLKAVPKRPAVPELRIEAPRGNLPANDLTLSIDLRAASVRKISVVGATRLVKASGDIHVAAGAELLLEGDATLTGITLGRFATIDVAEGSTVWVNSCAYVRWWAHLPAGRPDKEEEEEEEEEEDPSQDTRWRRLQYSLVWRLERVLEHVQLLVLRLQRSNWRPAIYLNRTGRIVVNGPFFGPLEIIAKCPQSYKQLGDEVQWVFKRVQDNIRPQRQAVISPRSDWAIYITDRAAAHKIRFDTPEPRWPFGVPILLDPYVQLREVTGTVTVRLAQHSYIHAGRNGLLIARVGPDQNIDQEISAKGALTDASLRSVALDGAWLSEYGNIELLKEAFALDVILSRDLNDKKFGRPAGGIDTELQSKLLTLSVSLSSLTRRQF
jgi:hypothetical protein